MHAGFLQQLLNAGSHTRDLPDYVRKRVIPANVTSLILTFTVAVPFIFISLFYMPPLVFIPVVGVLTGIGAIAANFMGGFRYARLVIATLPVWQLMVYNAYLCGPGEAPVSSLLMVSVSFLLTPFVKFDLREKGLLLTSVALCALAILLFPVMKNWFTLDYDPQRVKEYVALLETGWLSYLTVGLGIVAAIGSTLGLCLISKSAEKESDQMRRMAESQKEQLQIEKLQREEDLVQLRSAQADEKKRQWATEGIAALSDILHNHKEEGEIFDKITSTVVKYLGANQAGLYVVNRDEENMEVKIELAACYAYGRKKYLQQIILPGEGLLGQAYLEGDAIYLTEIPRNFVKIRSGLGEAEPAALLVCPFKVNGVVEALFEIASFKAFEPFQVDFVNRLGENVAAYVQRNRISGRTQELLQKAQQQSEELKAQEEEMRQNMEELAATQEEMYRKEQDYLLRIRELEEQLAAVS